MTVKVLVERWVKAGYESTVWDTLRQLRAEAVRSRGYIYGETWRSVDNPRVFVVLSVWASLEHWRTWADGEFRRKIEDRITPLLRRPTIIRFFEDAYDPPPVLSSRRDS